VLVRGLAEDGAELAAEGGGGEVRGGRQRRDVERIAVARVDQVFRAQEVPGRRQEHHQPNWSAKSHARRRPGSSRISVSSTTCSPYAVPASSPRERMAISRNALPADSRRA